MFLTSKQRNQGNKVRQLEEDTRKARNRRLDNLAVGGGGGGEVRQFSLKLSGTLRNLQNFHTTKTTTVQSKFALAKKLLVGDNKDICTHIAQLSLYRIQNCIYC